VVIAEHNMCRNNLAGSYFRRFCNIGISNFVNIFFFQNRKRQKTLIVATSIATIGFITAQFFIVKDFKSSFQILQGNWEISAILPIFILLFQVFAFIGIQKDEKLLSSADRLR